MTTKRRVEVTDAARAQILAASAWWEQNRPKAPGAVAEELDRILSLLVAQPEMGMLARSGRLPDVRRIALTRIRYYVYYRATDTAIQVLAFWHTSRGRCLEAAEQSLAADGGRTDDGPPRLKPGADMTSVVK